MSYGAGEKKRAMEQPPSLQWRGGEGDGSCRLATRHIAHGGDMRLMEEGGFQVPSISPSPILTHHLWRELFMLPAAVRNFHTAVSPFLGAH